MVVIQFLAALLLFLNKFYVRRKKAIGWIYGIIGAAVITLYFYLQMVLQHKANLWIMVVLDIALIVLMTYGYLIARSKEGDRLKGFLKEWNVLFKGIVLVITIFVCSLFLIEAIASTLVLTQFLFAVGSLFGTLLLAFNKKVTNIIGWVLYFVAHVILTYTMFKTDSPILAVFQILSALIAIDGISKELKNGV
ncbi:MAG: nicotinamide mononucleotide transporter [Candidatus Paceibacterota bacterium]